MLQALVIIAGGLTLGTLLGRWLERHDVGPSLVLAGLKVTLLPLLALLA